MKTTIFPAYLCCLMLVGFSKPVHLHRVNRDPTGSSRFMVPKGWQIGVQMWTLRMFSFSEALDKVDSAGIKHIEAFYGQRLGVDMPGSFGDKMSLETRAKLRKLLKSKGISIVAMGVIVPKNEEEWKKAFDLATYFGLSYVTAEPIKSQWSMIDKMAASYKIKVAIHDHPRPNMYWHPDSVLAAVAGHANIGSCADVGHWARNGLDPVTCLQALQGHIFGVHLKDIKVFGRTDAEDTVVSKGVVNFPAIFAELNRQHFQGMLSIEQESNWYHSLPDIIQTVAYFNEQTSNLQ